MKPEKPSAIELRKGIIQIIPVENDGHPRSHVILTNLKTLFRKQLPVMPREYIARLVFDSNSKCLAICKRGYKVVGGICYRPFPHRGFAEIVFFATASISQEKVLSILQLTVLTWWVFINKPSIGLWWPFDGSFQSPYQAHISRHDALLNIRRQFCSRILQEAGLL